MQREQPVHQLRTLQFPGGDPTGGNRWLAFLLKFQCFRHNYINYIQAKMICNNYITQYLMSMVLAVEWILDKLHWPKRYLFFIRGFYPIYLMTNIVLCWILHKYTNANTPNILNWVLYLILILKLIFSVWVIYTEPGKIEKDNRIEKYFKTNRKDLANVKAPLGLGTPPIRSNFCYSSRTLYARYELHSYLFMSPVAARNSPFYYLFYLNEMMFCILYLTLVVLNFSNFWNHSWIKFILSSIIFLIYLYKMYYDHKKIWITLKSNITMSERLSIHKNPVFIDGKGGFFNPFDRGFTKNWIEFFMPWWLCCCLPQNKDETFSEIVKKEFPDGIKSSELLIPRSKNLEENKTVGNNYEKIARDSTLEGSQDWDDEEEGRKIGDTVADKNTDLRYDIDAILENSICPTFEKHKLYNWYTARIYSVIDIKWHPMYKQAKEVLKRHLKRLQQIEKEQMEQIDRSNNNDDNDTEGEESEDDSEDEEMPGTNYGISSSHALPKPSGSSPGTHGPFKYGNSLPTKEQLLEQYEKVKLFRAKQFEDMEKRLENEEEKQNLNKERIAFFKQLEMQKDQQLNSLNIAIQEAKQGRISTSSKEDEEAFKIDNEEEDDAEGEEEEEEEEVENSDENEKEGEEIEYKEQTEKEENQPNLIDLDDNDEVHKEDKDDKNSENEDQDDNSVRKQEDDKDKNILDDLYDDINDEDEDQAEGEIDQEENQQDNNLLDEDNIENEDEKQINEIEKENKIESIKNENEEDKQNELSTN